MYKGGPRLVALEFSPLCTVLGEVLAKVNLSDISMLIYRKMCRYHSVHWSAWLQSQGWEMRSPLCFPVEEPAKIRQNMCGWWSHVPCFLQGLGQSPPSQSTPRRMEL